MCFFLGFFFKGFRNVLFVIESLSILNLFSQGTLGFFTIFAKYLLNIATNCEFSETKFPFSTNTVISLLLLLLLLLLFQFFFDLYRWSELFQFFGHPCWCECPINLALFVRSSVCKCVHNTKFQK